MLKRRDGGGRLCPLPSAWFSSHHMAGAPANSGHYLKCLPHAPPCSPTLLQHKVDFDTLSLLLIAVTSNSNLEDLLGFLSTMSSDKNDNEKIPVDNTGNQSSEAPSLVSDEVYTNPEGITEKKILRKLDLKLLPPLTLLYLLSFLDRSNGRCFLCRLGKKDFKS